MKLLIAWIILTFPVHVIGTAFISSANGPGPVKPAEMGCALMVFVPIWWGIYFLVS